MKRKIFSYRRVVIGLYRLFRESGGRRKGSFSHIVGSCQVSPGQESQTDSKPTGFGGKSIEKDSIDMC